jgi:hypothetical protein
MAEVEVKVDFAPIITELQLLARENFGKSREGVLTHSGPNSAACGHHVFEELLKNGDVTPSFCRFRLDVWLPIRVRKSDKSVAAVRSTGLRLLHFSNPEGFRGCHLQVCTTSLQNGNDWQDKFWLRAYDPDHEPRLSGRVYSQ